MEMTLVLVSLFRFLIADVNSKAVNGIMCNMCDSDTLFDTNRFPESGSH